MSILPIIDNYFYKLINYYCSFLQNTIHLYDKALMKTSKLNTNFFYLILMSVLAFTSCQKAGKICWECQTSSYNWVTSEDKMINSFNTYNQTSFEVNDVQTLMRLNNTTDTAKIEAPVLTFRVSKTICKQKNTANW